MPIRKVKGGFQWGGRGKVYATREQAARQARAAYANGYVGKSLVEIRKASEARYNAARRVLHDPSTTAGEKAAAENILRRAGQGLGDAKTHARGSEHAPPKARGGYRPPPSGGAGGFNANDFFRRQQAGQQAHHEAAFQRGAQAGARETKYFHQGMPKPLRRMGVKTATAAGVGAAGLGATAYLRSRNRRVHKALKGYTEEEQRKHRKGARTLGYAGAAAGGGIGLYGAGVHQAARGNQQGWHAFNAENNKAFSGLRNPEGFLSGTRPHWERGFKGAHVPDSEIGRLRAAGQKNFLRGRLKQVGGLAAVATALPLASRAQHRMAANDKQVQARKRLARKQAKQVPA